MRADRLVATLLFLQTRGRVTAELEALATAGIPVYSQPGRGGGWSLVGGARTNLTGLTAAEARTLFLVAGPSSAVTPEAKAALRKLIQALPETFRAEAEQAASAIVLDPTGWGSETPAPSPSEWSTRWGSCRKETSGISSPVPAPASERSASGGSSQRPRRTTSRQLVARSVRKGQALSAVSQHSRRWSAPRGDHVPGDAHPRR